MGRDTFRPDATCRLRRAAEGKGGAAWRRDRSHADSLLGGEYGEHGEDPPLARSEHRGIPTAWAAEVIHRGSHARVREGFKDSKDSRIQGF